MRPKLLGCALSAAVALPGCGPDPGAGNRPGESGGGTTRGGEGTLTPATVGTDGEHACQSWHSDLRIALNGSELGSSGPGVAGGLESCTINESVSSEGLLYLELTCAGEEFVLEANGVPNFEFSWAHTEVTVAGRGQRWMVIRRSMDDTLVLALTSNTPSLYPSPAFDIPRSEAWYEPLALRSRSSTCGAVPGSPHSSGCFCGDPMFLDVTGASGESAVLHGGEHELLGDHLVVVGTAAHNTCNDCIDSFPEQFSLVVASVSGSGSSRSD